MILKTKLFGTVYAFASVKEVMAKANEEKSGDHLAGIAAADAREIPFPVGDPLFLAGKVSPTDAGARLDGQSFVIWRA